MIIVRRTTHRDPERVKQEMEQMFRSLLPGRPQVTGTGNGSWRPPVEVIETEESLVITVEIAGIDENDLSLVVDGDRLLIRGERPDRRQAEKRSYHEARIAYGAFGADVFIPFPVDTDQTEAEYHNGFLHIVLPRQVPRTIVPKRTAQESL
jgi:HSP20 family molecular chaperone IbpA